MAELTQKIINKINVVSSRQCFDLLDEHTYMFSSIHLVEALSKTVSRSAMLVFLHLLHQQKLRLIADGKYSPVVVSIDWLAEKISRGRRTLSRNLFELEEKGFLQREYRFQDGKQLPSAITLVLPSEVQQQLNSQPKRKKPNLKLVENSSVVSTLIAEVDLEVLTTEQDEAYNNDSCNEKEKQTFNGPLQNEQTNNRTDGDSSMEQQAYNEYTKIKNKLLASGFSQLKANMKARQILSKEKIALVDKYLEKLKVVDIKPDGQKCPTDNINNIYVNNNGCNYSQGQGKKTSSNAMANTNIVNFKKYQSKKLTPGYVAESIKKFLSENKIPEIVLRNKLINDIVEEVKFHVANRNTQFTSSDRHALNAAKSMIKTGSWKTPLKYIYAKNQEAIAREKDWQRQKELEQQELKSFFNNTTQGESNG